MFASEDHFIPDTNNKVPTQHIHLSNVLTDTIQLQLLVQVFHVTLDDITAVEEGSQFRRLTSQQENLKTNKTGLQHPSPPFHCLPMHDKTSIGR